LGGIDGGQQVAGRVILQPKAPVNIVVTNVSVVLNIKLDEKTTVLQTGRMEGNRVS
jgi:hypothetical protein